MKKNGFTLIELVGVVVILAIIALVVFPATLSMLQNGQNEVDDSVKQVVESAAKQYVNDNKDTFSKPISSGIKNNGSVTAQTLMDNGYISEDLYTKYDLNNACIIVTSNSVKYFFEYKGDC